MVISFKKGQWEDKFVYAYTYRFEPTPVFVQERDHVRNSQTDSTEFGNFPFENISMFLPQKYAKETEISLTCSFDAFGAPLICLAEELIPNDKGILKYGNYIEVVLYEDGINVWNLRYDGQAVHWNLLFSDNYPVLAGVPQTLHTRCEGNYLKIDHADHHVSLFIPQLKDEYYFGLDACEGINRFYNMEFTTR